MCGIIGYTGKKDIESVLISGLKRLSYRGYDSSGIAVISDGDLAFWKQTGKIHELNRMLRNLTIQGDIGIGHTRWATHGEPNQINAHPHLSKNGKIAIVHNGIIENFASLRSSLIEEGYIFRSQTDSEVIAHLVEKHLENSLEEAVQKTITYLKGTYAIAVISEKEPDRIVVAKKGSPLVIGVGENENYVSSDINAILNNTKNIIYLDDLEIGVVTTDNVIIKDLEGKEIKKEIEHITWDPSATEKGGYDHFMLKEIYEQPSIVRNIISKIVTPDNNVCFKHLKLENKDLAAVNRFIIQACGTSWHAGLIGKYLFENYTKILTEVDISSEFRYRQMISQGNEMIIAISQSGETADTIACLREAKSKFFKILSFVNVKGSSIDRESDGVIYTYAGQEVGVASTKNYVAQLINFYLFTIYLGKLRWSFSEEEANNMLIELKRIPDYIDSILTQAEHIKKIAKKYHKSREYLFIGRGINYPSALEGALKLKEIAYIHATGYPAGELKHGPIALIDDKLPVVCIAPQASTYDKMISNIQEVKARKGKTIVIASEGDTSIQDSADDIIYIPNCPEYLSPILVAIPLQLLAYYTAVHLKCDVDQPRNLAKSVTVE